LPFEAACDESAHMKVNARRFKKSPGLIGFAERNLTHAQAPPLY
jgi:hypothetical protein